MLTVEKSLRERLSTLAWPVCMSVGDYLNCLHMDGRFVPCECLHSQDSESWTCASAEIAPSIVRQHAFACSALDCGHGQLLPVPALTSQDGGLITWKVSQLSAFSLKDVFVGHF